MRRCSPIPETNRPISAAKLLACDPTRFNTQVPFARPNDFLTFLRTIDRTVPKGLQIHLILDNYATHTHANVKAWLEKHPRFHLHFTRPRQAG